MSDELTLITSSLDDELRDLTDLADDENVTVYESDLAEVGIPMVLRISADLPEGASVKVVLRNADTGVLEAITGADGPAEVMAGGSFSELLPTYSINKIVVLVINSVEPLDGSTVLMKICGEFLTM